MKKITLGKTGIEVPQLAVGCMRLEDIGPQTLTENLTTYLENGLNFFDHADCYGDGRCEIMFAKAMKDAGIKREDVILQSKCCIRDGFYDFSKEYILESVDGILSRLETDYLDILLLHRPDTLMEPDEVAEAFDILESSGKVRHFGVSNHRPSQMMLLKKSVKQDLCVNQMQFSPAFSTMISLGMEANMETAGAVDRDGGVLDYCRLNDVTLQAWSPYQFGFFDGAYIGNTEKFGELNACLEDLAQKYNSTPTAIVAAWIARHPANIQIVAGTTNQKRMLEIASGCDITLTRKEWYMVYLAGGHILP